MENNLTIIDDHSITVNAKSLIDEFIGSLDVYENSKRTYKASLKRFLLWLTNNSIQLNDVTRNNILKYKSDLLAEKLSSYTVAGYITIVKLFFEWAESNRYYPNVARGIKTPKCMKGFKKLALSIEQIKQLLESIDTSTPIGLRNFAIINLLVRGGLRTIELIRANIDDITYKGDTRVLMIQGKGRDNKDAFIILTDKIYEPIMQYLKLREYKSDDPLFVSTHLSGKNQNNRLSTRTIRYIVKDQLKLIGIDNAMITTHSLRHTAGVNVLKAGGDLYSCQLFMRHSDPSTTQIYLKCIEEEHRMNNAPERLIDNMF